MLSAPTPTDYIEIAHLPTTRVLAVRFVMYVLLGATCLLSYLGWDASQNFGLVPADGYGATLAPLSHRILLSSALVATGLLLTVAADLFARHYIACVIATADTADAGLEDSLICLIHVNWWGWRYRWLPSSSIIKGRNRTGRTMLGADYPDTPYRQLTIANERVPFILDQRMEIASRTTYERLFRMSSRTR